MEDIAEEDDDDDDPVIDIDSVDSENPLAVVEYVNDLYEHYRKIEVNKCLVSLGLFIKG